MFKVTVNNTDGTNVVANAFQIGDQRTHAANQQINRYAGAGGRIQTINQAFIDKVI